MVKIIQNGFKIPHYFIRPDLVWADLLWLQQQLVAAKSCGKIAPVRRIFLNK